MESGFHARKNDATPMLTSGFKEIGAWQIDQIFLQPFMVGSVDSSRRVYLVNKLTGYLSEIRKFNIYTEVWIDGSFTTKKPDPDDIDLVVFTHENEVEELPTIRKKQFDLLTNEPDIIRARYSIHGFLAYLENEDEVNYWTGLFTKGHYSFSTKGFFKVML